MSNVNMEVKELLEEMVDKVVEDQEKEEKEVVEELVKEIVEKIVQDEKDGGDEENEKESEWPNQVGGASLKVLKKATTQVRGNFKGDITAVEMEIEIPDVFMADPKGPEMFGDAVIRLIHQYAPPTGSQTRTKVGVIFESPEIAESVGLSFNHLDKIVAEDIVHSMEDMAQSNKSPLELEVPKISMRITYLNPPSGDGKRKYKMEHLLNQILMEKRRREMRPEEENFETLHNNEVEGGESTSSGFLDECREVNGEDDESDGEEQSGGDEEKSGNVMRNNVSKDCLPHALYQALMYHEFKNARSGANYQKFRASVLKNDNPIRYKTVHDRVRTMKEKAAVTKSTDFDWFDIDQFQNSTVFAGLYQIMVFMENSSLPYYKGPDVGKGKELYILLDDGHYRGVRSLCALLRTSYYCNICETGYRNVASHYNCKGIHRLCGKEDCPKTRQDKAKKCEKCSVEFRSEVCYDNHLMKGPKGGKSRCDNTWTCQKCEKAVYRNKNSRPHVCGETYCHRCQCLRTAGHKCVMMVSKKNEKQLTRRRIYYDIESRADEETGQQFPVLFVAFKCCPECSPVIPKDLAVAREMNCAKCAPEGRLKVIECVSPDNRFVDVPREMTEWLFSKEHKGSVAVAHNASGYDGQFILEQLIASNKAAPSVALDGTKLIYLKHKGVRLLDSLKYLTMSLSAIGKAFEVDTLKGDFPVKFIQPENYDYKGPIPDNEYYALENKAPAVKEKLVKFLDEERAAGTHFNFYEEIMKYCFNDVYILTTAMSTFEKAFEAMNNVVLLEESVTAASAAVLSFRRNHLDNKKPLCLDSKPSASTNNSVLSQKYLAWIGHSEDVQINISTTYGETKIGQHRVDGFIPPCEKYPKGKIIEFFGCYFHAHTCKYADEAVIGEKTAKQIRNRDKKRIKKLEKEHPVEVVWECDINKELKENKEMAEFFENYVPLDFLQCERALVGGRTEVFRLFADNNGKKVYYLDVVSLYPTVMKHEAFPIGPPSNVQRSTLPVPMTHPDDLKIMGFLSCRVHAPRDLKLPLLPGRVDSRLMFFLCLKCAKDHNQHNCTHSDSERSFTGTWTTFELQKALSLGYTITEVFHGVDYKWWLENDENCEGGLFTSYINQMMEEKIYSSGWPANVTTPQEKAAYCQGYEDKEHIKLDDYDRFVKNPGKRAVAKLMLNSLWGKFAQRVDKIQTEIIIKPMKFWRLVHDTTVELMDVRPVNDVVIVKYRKQAETLQSLRTGAVHIAALVTSYARLRLYKFMESVGGDNIVYTDTDSIVYTVPDGSDDPLVDEIGPYLGQLTSELDGEMTEFVTTGPKTYCYKDRLESGEEKIVRKTKGVTINTDVNKRLNFGLMKNMVDEALEKSTDPTIVHFEQHTMKRNRDHQVFSKIIQKQFRYTFNKRRILPDGSTLPFGYC